MKDYLFTYPRRNQILLLLGDCLALSLSVFFGYSMKIVSEHSTFAFDLLFSKLHPLHFLVVPVYLMTLHLMDHYDLDRHWDLPRNLLKLWGSMFLAGCVVSGLLFFTPKFFFGREALVFQVVLALLLVTLWRVIAWSLLLRKSPPTKLAVVGHGQIISGFIEDLSRETNSGIMVSNICVTDAKNPGSCLQPRSVTSHRNLGELLQNKEFDALAFDSTNGYFSNEEVREILRLKFEGKAVHDLSILYENMTGRVPLTYIDGQWLLKSPELQGSLSVGYLRVKRVLDMVLSVFFLAVTAPLFLIIPIFIRLDSEGPVFFVMERLGHLRKPFKCYKFRTMITDAESRYGPMWATENDPRITRVGRILRKARLDELPQLWNVLKGDMTFVGPRPIREHFAAKLAKEIPFYELRFCIKPGLTGWAQVSHDYAGTNEGHLEKFQYELFYIRNMSLLLDALTIFKTVKTLFKRTGL